MWSGINVSDNSSGIHIEKTCIYDAQTAVNILNEPHVWIAQSIFSNNLRSIKVRLTNSAINDPMDVKIMANQFNSNNSIRDLCTADPHFPSLSAPNHSYRHIDLEEVYRSSTSSFLGVVIGDTTFNLAPNVFTNGDFGVFGTRSSTCIVNSEFHYIGNSTVDYTPGFFQSAVFLQGGLIPSIGAPLQNILRYKIGGDTTAPVLFDHCLNGAHSRGDFAFITYLENDFINDTDWDVYIWEADSCVIYLYGNDLDDSGTGTGDEMFYLRECNELIDFVMEDNVLDNSSSSNFPGRGIHTYDCDPITNTQNSPYLIFRDNYVANSMVDIFIESTTSAWVYNNKIYIPSHSVYSTPCIGIHTLLGSDHLVEHNEVYGNGTLPALFSGTWPSTMNNPAEAKKKGIMSELSDDNRIRCNYLENVSWNLIAWDLNINTKYTSNTMHQGNRGYVVADDGDAGDQVSPTSPCENLWTGSTGWWGNNRKVFSFYSNATAGFNQLYLRTPVQASPSDNGTTDPLSLALVTLTPVTLTSYPTNLCDQGGSNNAMAAGGDDGLNTFDLEDNSLYKSLIAKATLTETEAVKLHDLLVYQSINQIMNNVELTTELGIFEAEARAELALQGSDLEAAVSFTEAMNTEFTASLIQQQVNRFRIANRQSEEWIPTDSDLSILTSIANLCPKQYGRAVNQARSILANYLHESTDYETNCEDLVQNTERNSIKNVLQVLSKRVLISPNPISIKNLEVTLDLLFSGTVKLFSLNSGTVLQTWQLEAGKNNIQLTAEIVPGIYGISFLDSEGIFSTQKIVIQP